jgi:hypothetical protein
VTAARECARDEHKGLFGSVAIYWMAVDIHFFSGYSAFGLRAAVDRGNQMLRNIPEKYG